MKSSQKAKIPNLLEKVKRVLRLTLALPLNPKDPPAEFCECLPTLEKKILESQSSVYPETTDEMFLFKNSSKYITQKCTHVSTS